MSRLTSPRLVAALLGPALLAVTGCGAVLPAPGGGGSTTASDATTLPALSDVEPLADARDWEGEVVLDLPDPEIDPVADRPEPDLPVTVTDAQGTEVTVDDASRVLALDVYGTLALTVYELGLGDRVVGRDTSSQFEEIADKPLVTTSGHDLNAEAILALDPTVVLTDTTLGPWDVMEQVRDAGIPVVVTDSHRDVDTIGPLTQQVADALGVPEEGRRLAARIERATSATVDQIADLAPESDTERPRALFLYARGQSGVYYMFGQGSGADSLIDGAGAYDVSAEIGWDGMRPVNDEGLVTAQPDVVVMMTEGLESVGGVDGLLEKFPALAQTPAGEHRRVIAMDDDQVLSFGPRTPTVLHALALALYAPDAL